MLYVRDTKSYVQDTKFEVNGGRVVGKKKHRLSRYKVFIIYMNKHWLSELGKWTFYSYLCILWLSSTQFTMVTQDIVERVDVIRMSDS